MRGETETAEPPMPAVLSARTYYECYASMRPQGFTAANNPGGDERLFFQNAALLAQQQASRHGTRKAMKLHMTTRHRHASTSSCSSSRARVRPRPGATTAAPQRPILASVGKIGVSPSPAETRLASSVMAGDENIEQLSRMMTKRGAATSTAAVWGLGPSSGGGSSSSSSSSKGGESHRRGARQHRQHAEREDETKGAKAVGRVEAGDGTGGCPSGPPPAATVPEEDVNTAGNTKHIGPSEGLAARASLASGNEARIDAALVTARQKAFVKRVVELGRRRRPTEVLGLMEDAKREGFPPFNIYMYNACITALARCGRWRQAMAVLDQMSFTANAVEAAAAAAAAAVATNTDGAAVRAPSKPNVVRPDVVSYSAAITACGNSGEWRRALALLRVMREQGVPPNVVSYNAAAHACVGGRRRNQATRLNGAGAAAKTPPGAEEEGWALVLDLMAEMRREGVDADVFTFSTAITACGNAGEWERALDLLDQMGEALQQQHQLQQQQRRRSPIAPDVVSVNAAIAACGRAGQWERALDLLDRMTGEGSASSFRTESDGDDFGGSPRDSGDSIAAPPATAAQAAIGRGTRGSTGSVGRDVGRAGVTRSGLAWPAADAVSFNSAMEACANAGRWQEGIELLPRMLRVGVRPNVCSYAAHLACLRAGGLWERALLVLEEMSAGGGVTPDLGCYAAVMSTLGEMSKWEHALDLLRLLQRKGVEGATAWAAEQGVSGGAGGAASFDAERVVAEATGGRAAISSSPSAGPNLVCYNAALAACAKAREGAAALDLLEEMEGRGIFDTASFNCAMLACRGKGQWHKATAILDRMVSGDAVRRTGARDDRDGDTARRYAAAAVVPRPDAYSFASAITACGDVGQADIAVELLREMKPAGVEPTVVVFNAVIRAISRGINGPASGAVGRTGVGKERSEAWGGGVESSEAARFSAFGVAEGGGNRNNSWRRAYFLVVEMREAGLVPEVKTYNAVLAVCQRAGAWRGALEVLEEMKSGRAKRPVMLSARRGEAGAGESAWVEEAAPRPDLVSFNTAMGACGKAGRWEEALRLLDELSDFGLSPDAISYNTAAAACARAENWDRAQETVDRGRDAGVIASPSARSDTCEEMASDGGKRGETGKGVGPRSGDGGGGKRGHLGGPKDMIGFYTTVEEMVRRQKRGRKRSGGRNPGEPSPMSE